MDAWARLTGTALAPWEAAVLRNMDAAFLAVCADEARKTTKNGH